MNTTMNKDHLTVLTRYHTVLSSGALFY